MRVGRHGTVTAEFALMLTGLLLLLSGIVEAGRYFLTLGSVRTATADAARLAVIRGSANMVAGNAPCAGLSGSLAPATFGAPAIIAQQLSATLSGCTTTGGVTRVTVTLSYAYGRMLPLVPLGPARISDSTVAVFY
ncbi:TadE/TadG family type IV pilus assembly protein [Roseomonas sp. CCTCC AB2023176]|uniref:TadE/TadG family type IV pilus assembly protein n=1 Tax=Roseomonas sp. CCTCC AB2023176 TaxID=3342640 RepID=UPI0035DDB1C7